MKKHPHGSSEEFWAMAERLTQFTNKVCGNSSRDTFIDKLPLENIVEWTIFSETRPGQICASRRGKTEDGHFDVLMDGVFYHD